MSPLPLLVGIRFQDLFHSPHRGAFHLSLTVLCALSVTEEYLGLEGGPPIFRQDCTCPALLEDRRVAARTGLSPAPARLSRRFRFAISSATGLVRLRSPLLTESRLMSFPPATEMFQFTGFASPDQ